MASTTRRSDELPSCENCGGAMAGDGMYGYYCSVCGQEPYFAADATPYTLSALRFYIDQRGQYHYY
jgi:hypothetical protein